MIEPAESESLAEMNRFCEAMFAIREEISKIEQGIWSRTQNPLKMAPHTLTDVMPEHWNRSYPKKAAFPTGQHIASINRIDDVYGDENFCCSIPI